MSSREGAMTFSSIDGRGSREDVLIDGLRNVTVYEDRSKESSQVSMK